MRVEPVTLEGPTIRLEPLDDRHAPDLLEAAAFDEIWTYLDEPTPRSLDAVQGLITEALKEQAEGERLPFAIIDRLTGRAIGSVSYIDIQPTHHGLEIGWAWVTPAAWGARVSVEAATLLIDHAFHQLQAIRVAFKTDARNVRSQRAIERLGATREGTFRRHRILRDGHLRDSVYYSLLTDEWPPARTALRMGTGSGLHPPPGTQ